MTKLFNKKQIGLAAACALALGILSGGAQAQNQNPDGKGFLGDSSGKVVKSDFGLCWHTGFGPPPAPVLCVPRLAGGFPVGNRRRHVVG